MALFKLLFVAIITIIASFSAQFPVTKFTDQFDKKREISSQTKYLIIVFSKDAGKKSSKFLDENKGFLDKHSALYISELSGVPSIIMSLFMQSKFEDLDYSIQIIKDEKEAKLLPQKEDKITIVTLENKEVKSVEYIDSIGDYKF